MGVWSPWPRWGSWGKAPSLAYPTQTHPTSIRATIVVLALLLAVSPAAAADHFGVVLDWFINPNHAPMLVALQTGAYAAEGLDVELIAPADPTMGPKLVAAGQGDMALDADPQFFEQVAAGLPLVKVGVLIDRPLSTLVALRGSGIRRLSDLRGKRIGYESSEIERLMVGAMLRSAGLSLADVHMVQIGEQLSVALLSRQVDAVSIYRNFEPFELRQQGADVVSFDYESNGVPPFADLILVARPSAPNDTRQARFLRATTRGLATLRAHPDESWETIRRAYPDLDNVLNHEAWTATLPYFAETAVTEDRARDDRFKQFLFEQESTLPRPASGGQR